MTQLKRREIDLTTVSDSDTATWFTNLYRRPKACLGGLGRKRAIGVMKEAHPSDPYWTDDLKAMREQDFKKQNAVKVKYTATVHALKATLTTCV